MHDEAFKPGDDPQRSSFWSQFRLGSSWGAPAVVFILAIAAFWPALGAGFIWDDSGHVTPADLRSLEGLARIWFEPGASQQYYPVLHSAFWIEHRLWGDSAFGYHLLNIVLHATGASLLGVLLQRLAVRGAWFAALHFAVHPVCVESVAWISEQKNTLSTVLYLGAFLAYLRFDRSRTFWSYVLATGLFLLAILTKTVAASLPAAILVVFWWQQGRLRWKKDVVPLLLWFALALAAGTVTTLAEKWLIGADGANFNLSLLQRFLLAGRVVWFYLGSLLWPGGLVFIYPRWKIDPTSVLQYTGLFALVVVLAICCVAAWRRPTKSGRTPLAATLLFCGSLFPALGFVNVYPFLFSYVADHFQYLASMAFFAVAGAGLTALSSRVPKVLALTGGVVVLCALVLVSRQQSATYRDVFTLYETTLARNPGCWMAHHNLGNALADQGRSAEAIAHMKESVRLWPGNPDARNSLGEQLNQQHRFDESIPHLEEAVRLRPGYAEAHNNLGTALLGTGRADEGLQQFKQAILANPQYSEAHANLALLLAMSGQPAQALPFFATAVRLRPAFPEAELNWGTALMELNRLPEAIGHLRVAVRLKPGLSESHNALGRALLRSGEIAAAITELQHAIELDSTSVAAHANLAQALQAAGRDADAAFHFREALRLQSLVR